MAAPRLGGATALQNDRQSTNFLAPLPTVGVFGTFELMPKVILTGRADCMSLKIGDYDGSIFNGQAARRPSATGSTTTSISAWRTGT